MTDTLPSLPSAVAHVRVLSYLHWEREGVRTLEENRLHLLDALDALINTLNVKPPYTPVQHLLLGGQTALIEDVAQVRPSLSSLLIVHSSRGRLSLSPFYVGVDATLVSGEAIVRDLLAGQADLKQYGLSEPKAAYIANSTQLGAQFPQILQGFGIDALLLHHHEDILPLPFLWQAQGNRAVLVCHYRAHATPQDALNSQRNAQPDGPFVWMQAFNPPYHLPEGAGMSFTQTSLSEFVTALRETFPDELRPLWRGEANWLSHARDGRWTARLHLKQANARLQADLLHRVEPLLALALTHGKLAYRENVRALLAHAWRQLLQSQTPETLGGIGSDALETVTTTRQTSVATLADALVQKSLAALKPMSAPASDKTALVVWNLHGRRVRSMVSVPLRLAPMLYPHTLRDPEGNSVSFSWDEDGQTIGFLADVPSVGYRAYTLELSRDSTPDAHRAYRKNERSVSGADGTRLTLDDERLRWTWGAGSIADLLTFHDSGDAGTAELYVPPVEDVVVEATLTDSVYTETAPTFTQLVLNHRLRIAPNVENGRRGRGLRALDITTRATFYEGLEGLQLSISLTNTANDHSLRAHINTGKRAEMLLVGAPFALASRPANVPNVAQGVLALQDEAGVLALYSDSTPYYEAQQGEHTRLALTLLRAVGYADKARSVRTEGAQCSRAYQHRLWLTHAPTLNVAHLLHTAQTLHAPLYAYQTDDLPQTAEHSYLTLHGDSVLMTALKPPQSGDGFMIRLLNPTAAPADVTLQPAHKAEFARLVRLNESILQPEDKPMPPQDGGFKLTLDAHELKTLWVK